MHNYILTDITPKDYPQLVSVWESSVRATHHFLRQEDITFYKNLIPSFFDTIEMKAIKGNTGIILGFLGTSEENIEMLFVEANLRGKGIGRRLLSYALEELKLTKVDVNLQNQQALEFYQHFGFETQSISDVDDFGKPYPILHLELRKSLLPMK